jgi:hypothetical protein
MLVCLVARWSTDRFEVAGRKAPRRGGKRPTGVGFALAMGYESLPSVAVVTPTVMEALACHNLRVSNSSALVVVRVRVAFGVVARHPPQSSFP